MKTSYLFAICLLSSSILVVSVLSFTPRGLGQELELESDPQQRSIQLKENSKSKEEKSALQGIPAEINEIAKRITVRIDAPSGNGSGVIFAVDDDETKTYYVLTAKHVVEKEQPYQVVTPNGKSYALDNKHISKFSDSDLAVLRFRSKEEYQKAALGDYKFGLNEESWVFVYGWAKSNTSLQSQLTAGKVAGKETGIFLVKDDRSFAENNGYELVYTNLTQKGMSGGPILDTNGRVIGIHASAEGERYQLVNKLQLGFSLGIPISALLNSNFTKHRIASREIEIQTTKERLDIDPFAQPKLSKDDIDSIQTNLFEINSPSKLASETEWVNYGNQLWRLSRYQEAISAFDMAIKKESEFYQAYYGKGLALYNQGNYQKAVASFKKALELKNDFYPAWYRQSLCLLNLKQYNKALASIEQSIELKPENIALFILEGEALQNLTRYEEAIDSYSKVVDANRNSLILVRRGSIYRLLEKYDLALQDLNQAILSDPKYPEAYINRGLTYYQLGKYNQARANFNHTLNFSREDPRIYIARGFVNYKLEENSQSTVDFYQAYLLHEKNIQKKPELSNINIQPNKYGQLSTDFAYIFQSEPKAKKGQITLGQGIVQLLMGNNKEALQNIERASMLFQQQQDNASYKLTQKIFLQLKQDT